MPPRDNFSLVSPGPAWLVTHVPGPQGHRTGQPDKAETDRVRDARGKVQGGAARQGADFAAMPPETPSRPTWNLQTDRLMRSSKSRSRNKSNRQRSLGNIVNRVFDSSGPEGKVRGTPQQIIDKYLTLARDAQLSNDRVAEQSFLQHAEHYTRMLGEAQREMAERQQQHNQNQRQGDDDNAQPREGNGNGQNGGQNGRDHGNRDPGNREFGNRDHGGRDQGGRDQGGRDQDSRDQNGRGQARRDAPAQDPQPRRQDESFRDQRRDDAPAANDAGSADQPPAAEKRVRTRRQKPPVAETPQGDGLPDAVASDEGDSAAPVPTPETEAKDSKPKAPRARAPRSTTTRSRRKPEPDAGDAESAAPEQRADTAEGGAGQG